MNSESHHLEKTFVTLFFALLSWMIWQTASDWATLVERIGFPVVVLIAVGLFFQKWLLPAVRQGYSDLFDELRQARNLQQNSMDDRRRDRENFIQAINLLQETINEQTKTIVEWTKSGCKNQDFEALRSEILKFREKLETEAMRLRRPGKYRQPSGGNPAPKKKRKIEP